MRETWLVSFALVALAGCVVGPHVAPTDVEAVGEPGGASDDATAPPPSPAPPSASRSSVASQGQSRVSVAAPVASFGAFRTSVALPACGDGCFEPVIAAAPDGTLYVVATGDDIVRSSDAGATWQPLLSPPSPPGVPDGFARGDQILAVAPDGRLYYAAVINTQLAQLVPPASATPTWGPAFAGVHVASSKDRGESWDVNAVVGPTGAPGSLGMTGDRPWLAFAPNGSVYLAYHVVHGGMHVMTDLPSFVEIGGGLWVHRSDDYGENWSATAIQLMPYSTIYSEPLPVGVSGPSSLDGQLAVDHDGTVYLAALSARDLCPGVTCIGESTFSIFVSEDDGASFVEREVLPPSAEWPGSYVPAIAIDGAGALHAFRHTVDESVERFVSADGGVSWIGPETWSEGIARRGVYALAGPRGVEVGWHEEAADGRIVLRMARALPDAPPVRISLDAAPNGPSFPSDFAHFARLPGGGVAAVFADMAAGQVRVMLES